MSIDYTPQYRVQPLGDVDWMDIDPATLDGDGHYRSTGEPADVVHDNTRKAGFALRTLRFYRQLVGGDGDAETTVSDLLADLYHLSDALDPDLGRCDVAGFEDYHDEITGDI